jgi:TolB-like protein/DNA-binding winged helix-turn-helix (wHTH) protein/Tfp pilus assembly protein PilF
LVLTLARARSFPPESRGADTDAVEGRWLTPQSPQSGAQKVSAALSSAADSPPRFYDFEPFRLDVQKRLLLREGEPVPITPKVLETLVVLIERRRRVVDKGELMGLLWPDTVVEEANLTQSVFMARKALGEASGEQKFIATVPRRGYQFVAEVHEVQAPGGQDVWFRAVAGADIQAPAPARAPWTGWRWLVAVAVAVGATAVAIAAGSRLWRRSEHRGPIRSLAVLPLHNLSGDAAEDYFADGLTDVLITDLASVSALRTVSWQSVVRYKGTKKPLPEIARELGVDAILEGSVVRSGRKVRLTAQLVHASSERHIWATGYERDIADTLQLQGELARSVAHEVQARVTEREEARLLRRRPVDSEAYALYLRGRYFWDRRSQGGALLRSIEYFREAVDRDPTLAVAHAGMALAYAPLGYSGYISPAESRMKTQAAAAKALELDPDLVEAQTALAALKGIHDWDWEGGERDWKRVLDRSPNDPTVHLWYGFLLEGLGRVDEALRESRRALELDPLSPFVNERLAGIFSSMGQNDRAVEQYQRALELDPQSSSGVAGLGWAYLMKGMRLEGIQKLEEAAALADADPRVTSWLGHAYGLVGRKADARRILEAMKKRGKERYLSPFYLACIQAGLGERDAAFASLEEAYRQGNPMLSHVKVDARLRPLRSDARFEDLLRRMNLN